MVSVDQATTIVFQHLFKSGVEAVPVTRAVGRVLAEPITADRNFPPFHRVAMDGIAIDFKTWKSGRKSFTIEAVQAAGEQQKKLTDINHCIEVMTGAVLPEGTDAVIRYEDISITNGVAELLIDNILQFQNVHREGQDAKQAEVLLEPGLIISPAEIALLASVGKSNVKARTYPRAAIISTGDELVAVEDVPKPFQIRRSNSYALLAGMKKIGWEGTQHHIRDEKEILSRTLTKIVSENDVIILSGGVSKGKFDFLPEVLEQIGIQKHFHQVSQRPGKPFWFGASAEGKIVFALPGNPVSTFMCFHRFIKPWLYRSLGITFEPIQAILAEDFTFEPKLTYFLQVAVKNEAGKLMAYPDAGGGSGDFANLKEVNGFLELPAGKSTFKAGEVFPFIPFRD
jgi:molybdopterin molybdotransferase